MRWPLFCICLCTLLLTTGGTAFAKSRNVADNTRNNAFQLYQVVQQSQGTIVHVGNPVNQELHDNLIYTTDEEDDFPTSAPVRKPLQSILAYFVSAYLSQIDDPFANRWYRADVTIVSGLNLNQLCVFRI